MNPLTTCVTGVTIIACMTAFSETTLAKKTVIMDEELDETTAAGQPKVTKVKSLSGHAKVVNFQVNVVAKHISGGQEGLTTLTLNNIFGENQIANALNIKAGNDISGSQTYSSLQSWGSGRVHDSMTVAGQTGGPATCGATGFIAKCNAVNGKGAQGKMALLWEFADEIADAESELHSATAANVVVTVIAGVLDEFAQIGLTALTVNNFFGFNQVGNGLNIAVGSFAFGNLDIGGGTKNAINQANSVDQFRGSPFEWWKASTFSNLPNNP